MGERHRLLGNHRTGGDMRIGSLVKMRISRPFGYVNSLGIVKSIASPNPIVKVVWAIGYTGAYHMDFLEVIC